MNPRQKKLLLSGVALVVMGAVLSVFLWLDRSPRSVPPAPLPVVSFEEQQARYEGRTNYNLVTPAPVAPKQQKPFSPSGLIKRANQFSDQERAEFDDLFTTKLKPVIKDWCSIYGSHAPFDADRVSVTNFVQRFGMRPRPYSWMFAFDGITLSVSETEDGPIRFDYLMSKAAKPLGQLPTTPSAPLPPSVSRDEIMALLKADSGRDYPASEIAIRPTAYGSAMNGGVSVDVGQGVHTGGGTLPDFTMVFGPDGKLVAYGRCTWPRPHRQPASVNP